MDNLAASLPPPTPLGQGLSVHFQWGEQKFEMVASAASIRAFPWEDTGEVVTWLHCKGIQVQAMKPDAEVGLTSYLIPAAYVTHAAPGPTFRLVRASPQSDLGIFPPTKPAPPNAVATDELDRIIGSMVDASIN
jgi:hypothetical protein